MNQPISPLTVHFTSSGSAGLDFGTTNSALARLEAPGPVVAAFDADGQITQTFPSVLYFERLRHPAGTRLVSHAGPQAIESYLKAEEKGRLIQSLKSYLADRRFDRTTVFSQQYTLEDMIALIARHMLADAVRGFDAVPERVVVGRPVHFSNAREGEDDEFALGRLAAAVTQCGFKEIVFEYEPVAAAYSYEQLLEKDELILIGDFGGGTSDFSILHVGPAVKRRGRTDADILGNDGVAIAGDAFDKQIIRHLVAPRLGRGSDYLSPPDKFLPVPSWPYEHLERWHHLSFLNTGKNLEMLERIARHATIPERLEAFVSLIRGELGYQLHEAVRRTKFELTAGAETTFEFSSGPVSIVKKVTRAQFEQWIEPELVAIADCVDRLMRRTGIAAADIDHVFLTGGSSFVPAVRQLFIDRFGMPKITGGQELTSVATGSGASRRGGMAGISLEVAAWYDFRFLPPVPIVQRPRTWPFQGQNPGSNPGGDAIPRRTSTTKENNPRNVPVPRSVHCFGLPVGVIETRPTSSDETIGRAFVGSSTNTFRHEPASCIRSLRTQSVSDAFKRR